MEERIKKDILAALSEVISSINKRDFQALRPLSDRTIVKASALQDADSVSLAVVIYALSKVVERSREYDFLRYVAPQLVKCVHFLKIDADAGYRNSIKSLFKLISSHDNRFKLYIDEVINKAQIKKGSKLHEHGISMARAAEVLGIGQWELMTYIGKTRIHDEFIGRVEVRKRLVFARSLFR
ncbi:MAG: hypothetical protein ACE5DM_01190 [Candidatus Nanoarchaeia archaeon]